MKSRLVIVQPYVPTYRKPFFERLIARLALDGIECIVVAGEPEGGQARRGDSIDAPWLVRVKQRKLRLGGRHIGLGGSRKEWKTADAVIVGLLGSSIDTYLALLSARHGPLRVGVWGHIKDYVSNPHPLDAALERWQLRLADHVFAYTPGGTEYAEAVGVGSEHITTVMNTIDSTTLVLAHESVDTQAVLRFAQEHDVTVGKTLAFMGGLDESKRVTFIAGVLDELWDIDPEIRLLVAGEGVQKDALQAAATRGQAIMLGYAPAGVKALMGNVSTALLMPGRIGLVAVDALILQLPVLTTSWRFHAPEAEYLKEGVSRITLTDEPIQFALEASDFLKMAAANKNVDSNEWRYPTLDAMVENYANGAIAMMRRSRAVKSSKSKR